MELFVNIVIHIPNNPQPLNSTPHPTHSFGERHLFPVFCWFDNKYLTSPSSSSSSALLPVVVQGSVHFLSIAIERVRNMFVQLRVVCVVDAKVDAQCDSDGRNYGNHYDQDQDVPGTAATAEIM